MGTTEIIIVFAALMVLIAFVTIGVDWIGKPLKHRRFIPRMYRFEDEKLPLDRYGNPILDSGDPAALEASGYAMPTYQPPVLGYPAGPGPVRPGQTSVAAGAQAAANGAAAAGGTPPAQPVPVVVARVDPADDQRQPAAAGDRSAKAFSNTASQTDTSTQSGAFKTNGAGGAFSDGVARAGGASAGGAAVAGAFSHSLSESDTDPGVNGSLNDSWLDTSADIANEAKSSIATSSSGLSAAEWTVDMALDAPVEDDRPSPAIKATRLWMTLAATTKDSHYGPENLERMAQGKPPRRTNPRTGRTESMQVSGLRKASDRTDVFMHWPGESIDPWSAT